jgi:hypothetical protein
MQRAWKDKAPRGPWIGAAGSGSDLI